MTAFKV